MRGANVTVISENRHVVRSVTRALVSGGARVNHTGFGSDAIRSELDKARDLILIDADHDSFEVSNAVDQIAKQAADRKVLVLCRELSGTIAELILNREL